MAQFITDINKQTITIGNRCYRMSDIAKLRSSANSLHAENHFYSSLIDFLEEWSNESEYLKVHTSGSTGTLKELWVEKKRMMKSAMMTVSFLGLQKNDTAHLCMPLQYIAGKMVVVRALVAGLRLIISTPCGNPLREITEIPVFSAMTPMQVFNTVQIDRENEALKQINQLIIGGGSIDKTLNDILATYPNAIWSTYGMTETLSHIALRRLNGANASEWYTPLPNVSLSRSIEGTLIINAPDVAPQILETNDIVEFNSQNQFRIIGRKDNIINTGGIKVQIEQVEDLLKPLLKRPFMITAVPDSKFGERIVLLTEHNSLTEEKIKNAMETLPIYWRAKEIITIDKLPQTGTGKPDRAKAKRLATEATNR